MNYGKEKRKHTQESSKESYQQNERERQEDHKKEEREEDRKPHGGGNAREETKKETWKSVIGIDKNQYVLKTELLMPYATVIAWKSFPAANSDFIERAAREEAYMLPKKYEDFIAKYLKNRSKIEYARYSVARMHKNGLAGLVAECKLRLVDAYLFLYEYAVIEKMLFYYRNHPIFYPYLRRLFAYKFLVHIRRVLKEMPNADVGVFILYLRFLGYTNKEAQAILGLSQITVTRRIAAAYKGMNSRGLTQRAVGRTHIQSTIMDAMLKDVAKKVKNAKTEEEEKIWREIHNMYRTHFHELPSFFYRDGSIREEFLEYSRRGVGNSLLKARIYKALLWEPVKKQNIDFKSDEMYKMFEKMRDAEDLENKGFLEIQEEDIDNLLEFIGS